MATYTVTLQPDGRKDQLENGERYAVGDPIGDERLGDKTPVWKIKEIDHRKKTVVAEMAPTMKFLNWNPKGVK